ncbi:Exosome complex component rrp45 like protein [Verticillium longisporum]|uniref:Exosome complex component rrp45 like protein n=1 Tax=Verticillium longisporum TaxID=100787 RepID=A0A8I2Z876_VERLO|nr:Exosome complex component rrp45 like protein [Verticillium longisporum]
MPREAEPSVNEKEFILKALHEGVRLDGRPFDQYRNIDISFGDEYGVVDVSLGKTRVIVRISAEVTVPHADRPFDGIFQLATELSPMASPHFEPGKPTDTEMLLSRLLEKTIRRSGALDTESLCLVAGAKVWSVRADVHVVSHDGNIVDAACLAAVAALRHFRKPDAQVDGEDLTVFTPAERAPVPLGWLHSPFCVTFAHFGARDGGPDGDGRDGVTLLDPDWREEQLRASKLGGDAVEATTLLQCAALAARKVGELSDLVDRTLAADAKRRDKGGLMAELSAENDRVAG